MILWFQLAADAEAPIPMTQEEKDRVEGLLTDLDQLPEIPEDEDGDVRYKHAYIAWRSWTYLAISTLIVLF